MKKLQLRTEFLSLWVAVIFLSLILSPCKGSGAVTASTCGKERQEIKVLGDNPGDLRPPATASVQDLTKILAPTRKDLILTQTTRWEAEKHQYVVQAYLLGFKHEADGDFHIVLGDLKNQSITMIAEIVDPECAGTQELAVQSANLRSMIQSNFGKATASFRRLHPPPVVEITGVFFFDYIHGQTGVAPNGAELHPVVDLKIIEAFHNTSQPYAE